MIPRTNRLRDSKEFRQIARSGRKHRIPQLVLSAVPSKFDEDRFGFVVPKRVGNAVKRNLAKRRLRAVCYELIGSPMGLDVVFRAEKPILDLSFEELKVLVLGGLESLRDKVK